MEKQEAMKRLAAMRTEYEKQRPEVTFSALLSGREGTGKTTALTTAPKPVLIDSFDPSGTVQIDTMIRQGKVKKDEVITRIFWEEDSRRPKQYREWEKRHEDDIKTGLLKHVGTYCIDSGTTFLDALAMHVSNRKGRSEGQLAIQDYPVIYNIIGDIIKRSQVQGCHFIYTGHLELDKDEETGKMVATLSTFNKLKVRTPLLFSEKLVMYTKPSGDKTEFLFLTQPHGYYHASSQLGTGGVFDKFEKPDFTHLLKKAGLATKSKV